MRVHATTAWQVYYRNVDGILRCHTFFTPYHAEQFARAMRLPSAGVTEIEVREANPLWPSLYNY